MQKIELFRRASVHLSNVAWYVLLHLQTNLIRTVQTIY